MEKLKRITKLRPEWEAAIPEWNKKWIAAGLSTEPADFKAFERGAKQCYAFAGVPWPGIVVRVPSPIVGALAAPIAAKVIALARAGIFAPGIRPTKNKMYSAVGSAVGSAVYSALKPFWHYWFGGSLWCGWRAFCSFFTEVCGLDVGELFNERLAAYNLAESSAGCWWANKDFVMVSDRPEHISLVNGQLHSEKYLAIKWRDGWGLWMLNGVRVPEWLVMTPERDLDPAVLTKIDNAEVRREFVRKVGAERIVSALSPGAIDKASYRTKDGREHPYELHRLNVGGDEWSYLRMLNPSVGLVHFEGVPNECRTVQEALNFRNGLSGKQISSDGAEWFQQGDVVMLPRGAKTYQPFPSVLT